MKNFSSALIIEKNKLSSPYPWIPLVHFAFAGPVGSVWLAGNLSNVTYLGQVYTAFDIEVQLPNSNLEASIPECRIIAANQSRAFEEMLLVTGGGVDTIVTLTIVNTNNLGADYSALTWTFTILQATCNSNSVEMTCSLYSPLDRKFPPDRYYGTTCRYKYFKGSECRASHPATTCNRSLDQCRQYLNQTNFGGFPGIFNKTIAFLFTKRV